MAALLTDKLDRADVGDTGVNPDGFSDHRIVIAYCMRG
jgi:hypothetical protein